MRHHVFLPNVHLNRNKVMLINEAMKNSFSPSMFVLTVH